jgi:glycerophosphoryl diester phosphodiesterase
MEINWLLEYPFAHRGLHSTDSLVPENSMKAFERAIGQNYAIELDVQVISDQEVVVFHDYNIKRLCGVDIEVKDLTKGDLNHYKLLKSERIPLLEDVLQLVNGAVPLLIEIKRQPAVKHANMIIRNCLLNYRGPVAIISFDPLILRWFARNAEFLVRGQLSSDFREENPHPVKEEKLHWMKKFFLRWLLLNRFSRPHFLAYDVRALPCGVVARRRKKGMVVLGWTVRGGEERLKALEYCDNIIFEGFCP